jgi:hypothetical protein
MDDSSEITSKAKLFTKGKTAGAHSSKTLHYVAMVAAPAKPIIKIANISKGFQEPEPQNLITEPDNAEDHSTAYSRWERVRAKLPQISKIYQEESQRNKAIFTGSINRIDGIERTPAFLPKGKTDSFLSVLRGVTVILNIFFIPTQ